MTADLLRILTADDYDRCEQDAYYCPDRAGTVADALLGTLAGALAAQLDEPGDDWHAVAVALCAAIAAEVTA